MQTNKVKLLNNYQLFQLAQNRLLDSETLHKVQRELALRNISTIEQKELEQRYYEALAKSNKELDENSWNPFFTAFAWKRHFRNIALLKSLKRDREATAYQWRFYCGMGAYMLLLVSIYRIINS